MPAHREATPRLDRLFPFRGPCCFCDHPDARHRLWDALVGMVRAGDPIESVAKNYGLSIEAVRAVVEDWGA